MTNDDPTLIDEYISRFPEHVQSLLLQMRKTIQKVAPTATEKISYQIPTFSLNGRNLVHFAAFKKHIGFYPTSSGTKEFENEITEYKHAKGSIQFPLDEPLPLELVAKITVFRVKEVAGP